MFSNLTNPIFAAAAAAVFAVPVAAQAVREWDCGAAAGTVTCRLSEADSTFTVSGTGKIGRSNILIISGGVINQGAPPWYDHRRMIAKLVIEEGVTSIADVAFHNCFNLRSVAIARTVTEIGSDAFAWCGSLASIDIPAGVTKIDGSAFRGCTSLESVAIPDGVTKIGSYTFAGCTGLASVKLPENLAEIDTRAFENCAALTSVTFGGRLKTVGSNAFSGCKSLASVIIPDSVTSIGAGAFDGCTGLTSVTLGSRVTAINRDAFKGCTGLTSFTIPGSVTSIGAGAFDGCAGLKSVTFPARKLAVYGNPFSGCAGITSIKIGGPQSGSVMPNYHADSIPWGGIGGGVTELVIEDGVTVIGNGAFKDFASLESVVIPGSVVTVGSGAFEGGASLASVQLGAGVKTVRENAFGGCASLASVISLSPTPPTVSSASAFPMSNGGICLYVPEESMALYGAAAVWGDFECIQAATAGMISVRRPPAGKAPAGSLQVSVRGNALYVSMPEQQRTTGMPGTSSTPVQVRMIDVKGRTALRENLYSNGRISLSHIPAGRYIIDIRRSGVRVWRSSVTVR